MGGDGRKEERKGKTKTEGRRAPSPYATEQFILLSSTLLIQMFAFYRT